MNAVDARVQCYSCGRRAPAGAPTCPRCKATFHALCTCGAVLSVFDARCGACGAEQTPKRLPWGRRPSIRAAKWTAVAVCVGAAAWVIAAPRPVPTWKIKAQAIEAYQRDDFQTAAAKLRTVTEQSPADAEGWYLLAVAYLRLGFRPEAYEPLVEHAVLLAPNNVAARDLLARTELGLGRLDRAREHAEKAVRAPAADGAAWQLLAEVELAGPRPDLVRVEDALRRARAAGRDTPEVKVMLAETSLRRSGAAGGPGGLAPGVEQTLRAALAALDSPRARFTDPAVVAERRAVFELALGMHDEAFASADAAYAGTPRDAPNDASTRLRMLRAMALFARGGRPEALAEFAAVLRARPDGSTAATVASFVTASGDAAAARALLSDAADAEDPRGELHAALAGALLAEHDLDGAARAIAAARAKSPSDGAFAEIDGAVCAARGRFSDAKAALEEACRAAPQSVSRQVRLALVDVDAAAGTPQASEALRGAVRDLKRLRGEVGDDVRILRALGGLELAAGDAASAREDLEVAVAASPTDVDSWMRLAQARRGAGGEDSLRSAADAWEAARALRPDDASLVVETALARLSSGDAAAGAAVCTERLNRRPDEAPVLRARAACRRQLRMWDAAAQDLARLRGLPGSTEADIVELVDARYKAGDVSGARDAAESARGSMSPEGERQLDFLEALHVGDLDRAIAKLREGGGSLQLADVQFAAGRADDALETLREVWRRAPGDPPTARAFVVVLLAAEKPPKDRIAEARAVLAAIATPSPPGVAEFVAGRILLAEGDVAGAVEKLRSARRELPDDAVVALYLGEALFASGERTESLAALRRAAALPGPASIPHVVAVHLYRASMEAKDADRAEALAVEALQFDRTVVAAAFRAVALLHARGRFAEAADLAQSELSVAGLSDADAARLHLMCANDRLLAGDFQAAATIVESLPTAARESPAGRLLAAFADVGAQRLDDAAARFASVAESDPARALAVAGLALIDVRRGDRASALRRVDAWRKEHSDDRDVTLATAQFLARGGFVDDAARLAETCAAARTTDVGALLIEASMLRRAGRAADAVAAARRFAAAAPAATATDARILAATIAVKCGIDVEGALADVRAAIEAPSVPPQTRTLARATEAEALSALRRDAEADEAAQSVLAALAGGSVGEPSMRLVEARARFVIAYDAAIAVPPRRAQAVVEFTKCLDLDPMNLDAANDLAWVLSGSAETAPRALDLARRATSLAPETASYWDTRAEAASRAGDADDADASWTKAVALASSGPRADPRRRAEYALNYGRFLRGRKRDDAARAVVTSALEGAKGTPAEAELRRFLAE